MTGEPRFRRSPETYGFLLQSAAFGGIFAGFRDRARLGKAASRGGSYALEAGRGLVAGAPVHFAPALGLLTALAAASLRALAGRAAPSGQARLRP